MVEEQADLFETGTFAVELDVFSGPFEVLLSLIARKKLDVTEIALGEVTDEFIAFVRMHDDADLSHMSEFLVVAATLLEMKAARLLPQEVKDEEDIELLEARDLLFAKLLQYRAFKEAAADMAVRLAQQSMAFPRDVPLEPQFAQLLPEVRIPLDLDDLAALAARAFSRTPAQFNLDHVHDPVVPVETQVAYLRQTLIVGDRVSFSQLGAHQPLTVVVSRFLAVLELLRNGEITVEQDGPLRPLYVIRLDDDEVRAARDAADPSVGQEAEGE